MPADDLMRFSNCLALAMFNLKCFSGCNIYAAGENVFCMASVHVIYIQSLFWGAGLSGYI